MFVSKVKNKSRSTFLVTYLLLKHS